MANCKPGIGFVASCARKGLKIIAAGTFAVASAQVSAGVLISSATVTNYTYGFYNGTIPKTGIGAVNTIDANLDNPLSQVSLDTVSTANGGAFYFLHNNYCLGECYVSATTVTILNLTNTGTDAVALSLDSQITAGYMAFQSFQETGTNSNTRASFNFSISQQTADTTGKTVVAAQQLYGANGQAAADNFFIDTSDGVAFTGLTGTDDGTVRYFEWDPTDLNLGLGALLPGYTTTIIYQSTTQVSANSPCEFLSDCDGAQVAFGDPRNDGGVTEFSARSMSLLSTANLPVIGRQFAAADQKIVVQATPVPEPATWAMLIGGFSFAGGIMRRRQKVRAT